MKKVLQFSFLLAFLFLNISPAQTIDDFNYTGNLTENGWSVHSGSTTNPIATATGLTYTGYIGSGIGNAALIQNLGGQDVNQTAGIGPYSTDGNVIYFSFMVNVTETGTKTGDYFLHIGNRVSASSFTYFCARVFAKVTAGVVSFGISNTSTATYGTTNFATNTTYLLVVKYVISTAGNDEADLWVFTSGVPTSEVLAGTPEVSNTATLGQDIVNAIALRQGSSTTSVQTVVDGIRLATSWSALLPPSGSTTPIASAATNVTANSFTTNWSAVTGATNYILDVSTASDFSTFVTGFNMKDVGNVTSYVISGLDPNTIYYYRVHAWDGTNASPNSNTITVTTAVAAPVATAATNVTTTSFTANWDSTDGATNYWLDVSTASDFSALVTGYDNKDVGNATIYDVSSLSTGNTYYYRVRASNANGTSENSNIITVGTGVLAAPLALNATNITTSGFTVRWNSSPTATTYLLDLSTASDFSTFVTGYDGKDVGDVTSYSITSLNGSTTYYYRVRASNSGGTSANSNTITVITLLAAPVATAATNITTTGFTANWNASTGATSYWIDISTTDDFSNVLASYNNKSVGNVATYSITSLNPNTTYYFRVCASNAVGTSPYSNTITVATTATSVEDLLSMPTTFELFQNYPNPFNPTTTIKYQIPENSFVSLKVYNVIGSEIAALVNDTRSAGTYEIPFDASQLTSGIYIYKIQAGQFSQMKKMILVK